MTVMSTTPTLFRRLGGMLSIDAAVDAFYDRVIADPELAPFFERVDLRDQRRHQKAFLAMALGGPLRSGRRSLADAHAALAIDDHHVDLVLGHLATVLAALGVTPPLLDEVSTAVESLRDDLLGRTHGRRAKVTT